MTIRVERTFELSASPDTVWNLIADPAWRARSISVVERFEITGDRRARWHVRIPLPLLNRTIAVDTRDVEREEPNHVRFVGRSKVMRVMGEHELVETDDGGTRLVNRFVVEGKLPGVERFFESNLDAELENMEAAIREDLEGEG